jgi:hypothetical protein
MCAGVELILELALLTRAVALVASYLPARRAT